MKDDTIPDPGAHTLEVGLSVTGPSTFPITLSGYVNVYNDAGSNSYFQADYPVAVSETELTFFCGVAGANKKRRSPAGNSVGIGLYRSKHGMPGGCDYGRRW